MKKVLLILFSILLIVGSLLYPYQASTAVTDGFSLWFTKVLPTLMPIGILSYILIKTNVSFFIGSLMQRLMKGVFNISGNAGYTFFIGIISGYPMGAMTMADQYAGGEINDHDVYIMKALCTNCGLLFAVNTVAVNLLNQPQWGAVLYLSHILSSVILSSFLAIDHKGGSGAFQSVKQYYAKINTNHLGQIITDAVVHVSGSMLRIGIYISVFSLLSALLNACGALDALSSLAVWIHMDAGLVKAVLTGILEITNGCSLLGNLDLGVKALPLAAGLIAWSGLSIHMQSLTYLNASNVKYSDFFKIKALQSVFSYLLCTALIHSVFIGALISILLIGIPLIWKAAVYRSFSMSCSRAARRSPKHPPM